MGNGVGFESTAPSMVSSTAGCPVFCWMANGSVVVLEDVVSWLSVLQVSIVDEELKGKEGVLVLGSEILDPVSRWILSLILSILRISLLMDVLETEIGI